MLKNFFLMVFMFLAVFTYGQKSTLLQNINFRAKELKHSLNKAGDSLILKSDKTIYSVEIFNQDFEKTVQVGGKEIKIPLDGTPLGRLVVQAKMIDKRILMTLLRHETIKGTPLDFQAIEKTKSRPKITNLPILKARYNLNNSKMNALPKFIEQITLGVPIVIMPKTELQLAINEEALNIKETEEAEILKPKTTVTENSSVIPPNRPRTSITDMLNWRAKKPNTSTKVYWISYLVNSGTSSRRTMKMATQTEVDKLIAKHKIESKTNQGKLNELTIWEVYDTAKFMEKQTENNNYINSITSRLFNVNPYYSSNEKTAKEILLAQGKPNN